MNSAENNKPKNLHETCAEGFRFAIARRGLAEALELASQLMRHAETGDHFDEYGEYHTTAELVVTLAKALHESTQP